MSPLLPMLVAVVTASVAGSLHCIGMCGPLALLAASRTAGVRAGTWPKLIAFNAGRLVMYSLAGLAAGTVGLAIDWGSSLAGWQRAAAWSAGVLMIIFGTLQLLGLQRWWEGRVLGWFQASQMSGWLKRFSQFPPTWRAGLVGAMTSLLPCGWLHVFVLGAAGTGHPMTGLAVMLAFWLGTLPALVGVVLGFNFWKPMLARRVPVFMGAAMLVLGIYTLTGRTQVVFSAQQQLNRSETALQQALQTDPHSLPCCQNDAGQR